ncbi:hypothetical protein JCM16303_001679 [Sporobolomyces ruberrimus]
MPDSLFGDSDSEDDPQAQAERTSNASVSDDFPLEIHSTTLRKADDGLSESTGGSEDTIGTYTTSKLFATSEVPPIPGLYLFQNAIPVSLQGSLALSLSASIWPASSNQVMLFDSPSHSSLPEFFSPLLDLLPSILWPLPDALKDILYDVTKPRQCILNLYHPGQGISAHVDLPSRYEDGIVGISLLSSTVMELTPVETDDESGEDARGKKKSYALRLKPGSVYVLSGPARYEYKHGIPYREGDNVVDEDGSVTTIRRGVRMSITLRRMKEGAEIIGPS